MLLERLCKQQIFIIKCHLVTKFYELKSLLNEYTYTYAIRIHNTHTRADSLFGLVKNTLTAGYYCLTFVLEFYN